jgi:NADPH:quinone reductase-like Zn-dependent oxidoreductase
VTGVCSTHNVELVRSLGADRVVDYTREDFTRTGERYDVIFDVAGSRRWSHCKRVLAGDGKLVVIGGPKKTGLLGPVGHMLGTLIASTGSGPKAAFFIAKRNRDDLQELADLLESGKVVPVVDRCYDLSETAEAFAYLATWHARGKIVVTV